jgi:cell division protein FtsB
MKKKFLLPIVLLAVIILVLFNVFNAGDKHVTVVKDNENLVAENGQLKTENGKLKSENSQLKEINNKLSSSLISIKDSVKSTIKQSQGILPKAIIKIEKEINAELGWCTPDMAYSLLEEKLGKIPSKEEYKETLLDLLDKDMLYFPGNPDPYVKGKKVSKSKIDKIINKN